MRLEIEVYEKMLANPIFLSSKKIVCNSHFFKNIVCKKKWSTWEQSTPPPLAPIEK